MRQKIASACLGAGLGLAGPGLFCKALALGAGTTWAAALVALAAAFLWALAPALAGWPGGALAFCAACAAALWLPWAGLKLSLAAALLLLLAGLALSRGGSPVGHHRPWDAALAGACAVAWTRLLNLLGADALSSLIIVFSAAAAAACVAKALRRLNGEAGFWGLASGLAGLLGLSVLRFVGLNAASPELLQKSMDGRDLFWLASHAWAAVFFWSAAAGAPAAASGWGARLLCGAGPAAAACLLPRLGSAQTAAFFHLLTILAAVAALGVGRLRPRSMTGQATAAALAAALWLGAMSRRLLPDVWLNRLNAAFPGGRYLALEDDGRESSGLYRFSSGATVLLREGGAWSNPEATARRQAHLALLSHPAPRRVLLSVLSPASTRSVLTHGVEAAWLGGPSARAVMSAASGENWPWPPAGLTLIKRGLRQTLKNAAAGYDVILMELPVLPSRPFFPAREDFAALKAALTPEGVLALRLPSPRVEQLPLILAAAAPSLPNAGAFDLPGGPLLIFSEKRVRFDAETWRARLSLQARLDDIELSFQLPTLDFRETEKLPAPAAAAPTQDKP